MSWQYRNYWLEKTFKPIKRTCDHPAERLVFQQRGDLKHIVCLKCGKTTARQRVP